MIAKGPVLCISPWNFPLAIFIGQVAAALVTGNTVLAKPAEQTSLIAQFVVDLIYKTGIDKDCVQLLLGSGLPIGKLVIPDERIQTVMFTGSCKTAAWINNTLAKRENSAISFIAETGGQNVMIVDSTALLEKAVDDVITSGFYSAGQRCSSLRVLYVQEEVADDLILRLQGAMAELAIGNPMFFKTDIGPIIDQKAIKRLNQHCEFLRRQGNETAKLIYECSTDKNLSGGHYFAPRLYEINSITILKEEVFGPIIHLIRYKAVQIDKVIDEFNQSGYGLTLGIHSRLQAFSDNLATKINVGNVYINRSMVGAVVGVQPFGGRALSGTGPKAGGKHYLEPLVKRLSISNDMKLSLENQLEDSLNVTVLEQAQQAWSIWQQERLEHRSAVITSWLAEFVGTKHLSIQQECIDVIELMTAKLKATTQLPGPTGEKNLYCYESRGIVAVIGDDNKTLSGYLAFILAALYAGNVLICAMPEKDKKSVKQLFDSMKLSGMPKFVCQFVNYDSAEQLLKQSSISAVISPVHNHQIKYLLAQRKGPITPLIVSNDCFALNRLLLEKTISTDTTAAIGNALLLSQ